RPDWTASVGSPSNRSQPIWANGIVYVGGDRLYAFPEFCRRDGGVCGKPIWVGPVEPSYRSVGWSTPAVVDGVVFSATDLPWAFPATCATGGQTCQPLWVGPRAVPEDNRYFGPAATPTQLFVPDEHGVLRAFEPLG